MPPEDFPAPPSGNTPGGPPEPNASGELVADAPIPLVVPLARSVSADGGNLGGMFLIFARPAPRELRWWLALLEAAAPLIAAFLGTILEAYLLMDWRPADDRWTTIVMTVFGGLFAIAACAGLLAAHGQRLSAIGWTTRHFGLDVAIGIGAYLGTLFCLLVLGTAATLLFPSIAEHQNDAAQAIKETLPEMSLPGVILFMAFVALWEEICFRGFMLTRLHAAFKRWWIALPVGAVLFGFVHSYEGPIAIVQTMLLGIVLGLLFWWRRSLVPGIVFHALNNVAAYALMKAMSP